MGTRVRKYLVEGVYTKYVHTYVIGRRRSVRNIRILVTIYSEKINLCVRAV